MSNECATGLMGCFRIGSPANIEQLLWYHTRVGPYPTDDSPMASDFVKEMIGVGVIEGSEGSRCYRLTLRGKAWVEALCNVALPTIAYVDEHGNVIKT